MKAKSHKIGAVMYILWGLLHVAFGGMMLLALSSEGGLGIIKIVGTAVPASELSQTDKVGAAMLAQHAWNLIWFGVFGTVVAMLLNWKNSKTGYWFNLVVVSAADIGFVVAIMLPGYITMKDGLMGPMLWVLAVIFSTIGYRNLKKSAEPAVA